MSNKIQVWPDKYRLAIKSLSGPHTDKEGRVFIPELGHPYSVHDAMTTEHLSDAHMTMYSMVEKDGSITSPIPLMSKHVLKQVRQEGADLLLNAIALDWDVPGHLALSPETLCDFLSKFMAACASDDRLDQWSAYHTTRHGCRIIYELSSPVPVDDGEKYIVSLIKEFKRHDVLLDPACKDWTRRFRLPKVVRDGLHTKDEPLFTLQLQDKKLDITQFKKSDIRSLTVVQEFVKSANAPSPEVCHAVLYEEGPNGREVMTGFHKRAKAMIKQSTPYGDRIFDSNYALAGDTGRNEAFQSMLGVIVPKMLDKYRASPEQIYALFDGPIDALELIPGKQHPKDHFWNFLMDIYEREYAIYVEKEEKKAEAIEEGQTALERMVEGMQQWCDAEDLFSDDNTVREAFVRSHILANVTRYYYPMNKDGWYSSMCLTQTQLVAYIRKSFLKDIIETEKLDMRGDTASVSPVEIANNYSTVVHEVRMSPLQGAKGRIDDIDGEQPSLMLPMYQRNEFLPAVHHPEVDGWLRALFGKHYAEAVKWLGYALAFEEGPICALSVSGSGSVGKKLLVEGLAECLVDPSTATGHDMCGAENGAILKTPFLVVNEGMPRSRDMSPSDTFKSLTAGDPIRVRELYKPSIQVINPMRLIFTANDHAVLQSITKGKELTPATRKAMGERLLHFDVDDKAEAYLRRLGGRSYTEKDGARWIRGDSGQDSDFIVAQHFMHLYKTRPPRNPSDRYCVMGNCNEVDSFQIASQSEFLPMVMRGIINLAEKTPAQLKSHVAIMTNGDVYITSSGVFGQIKDVNQERISERAMDGILKSLMKDSQMYQRGGLYFRKIDPAAVLDWAQPNGYPCPKIEEAARRSKEQLP